MPPLSLRAKLSLGVLLILAPILGLLLYGAHEDHVRQRAAVLAALSQTSQAVAALVEACFDETFAIGWALATEPAIQTLDAAQVAPRLEQLAPYYPQYDNLAVFDAQGELRGESVPTSPGTPGSIRERPYFQQVLATSQPVVIPVLLGQRTGRPVAGVAVPILGPGGDPRGLVRVSFTLEALAARLASVGLAPGQAIILADPAGRIAAHTALPELSWEARDLASWPEVRAAVAGRAVETIDFHSPLLGDTRAAAFVPTPKYGWVAAATLPRDMAFGSLDATFRRQLLAFGAVVLLAVLAAVLLATYVVGPVGRLAVLARALGRGDLSRRAEIKTGDELEALGAAFNHMAADLEAEREGRERFVSAVAHDLRGPVTVIRGYATLLRQSGGQDATRRERALQAINDATEHLERMVGDLLEVSHIVAGRFEVRPELIDLMALVRQLVEAHQHTATEHRLALAGPARLEGCWDRDRLAQVVSNLLGNAVKYSPEGDEIQVIVEPRDGEVHLRVSDQGVGLRPEDLPRVFEPFERLEEARSLEGAGLGLFICKGIVEAHGGRIWAESAGPDQGSTFHVMLPASPEC